VCGSPGYFASHGTPRTPDDLAQLTCVTFSGLPAGASWAFKAGRGLVQAAPPRCRLNVNTAEAAIDSALAGVGITHVLSYQVAQAQLGQLWRGLHGENTDFPDVLADFGVISAEM